MIYETSGEFEIDLIRAVKELHEAVMRYEFVLGIEVERDAIDLVNYRETAVKDYSK